MGRRDTPELVENRGAAEVEAVVGRGKEKEGASVRADRKDKIRVIRVFRG